MSTVVSNVIMTSLIVVFVGYSTAIIQQLPCNKNLIDIFLGNFVHVDLSHLLFNLLVFISFFKVETRIGSAEFIKVVSLITIILTLLEYIFHKLTKSKYPCSIGFSGIAYGVLIWELLAKEYIDYPLLLGLIVVALSGGRQVSTVGHFMGILSGLATSYLINHKSIPTV